RRRPGEGPTKWFQAGSPCMVEPGTNLYPLAKVEGCLRRHRSGRKTGQLQTGNGPDLFHAWSIAGKAETHRRGGTAIPAIADAGPRQPAHAELSRIYAGRSRAEAK